MVDPSSLQVGELWETGDCRMKLPLRNTSNAEVRVSDVFAGCSCMKVLPQQFILRPDEAIELTLAIDLTKRAPWERHLSKRPISLSVRPLIEGSPLPSRGWLIEGSVRSRVTFGVETLGFGDRPVAGAVNEPRAVKVRVHTEEGPLEANVLPAEAGSAAVSKLGDGEYAVAISPAASLPAGPFAFRVDFALRGSDGRKIPSGRVLPVEGVMQPEVRALPTQLLLGAKPVGSTAEAAVRLQSPAGSGWVVDRVEVDSADLKVEADGADYRIRQQIAQEGDQSHSVRFFVRKGPKGEATPIRMTVSYFGLGAKEKP